MLVGGRRIGYLIVESATAGFYTDVHAERLRAVADQAGAALSNARLASKASEVAATDERQRLSRELHDAVNQTLWTASLTAGSLLRESEPDSPLHERLERLQQLTAGALAEMRALLLEMRPNEITRSSLADLIDQLLTALECRKTFFVTADLQPVNLDPMAHLAFYRIAQEAISNIARHSHAASLDISLTDAAAIELCISDDGDGFDPAGVPPGHLGLSIMQERADRIGADFSVTSAPGRGTRLCFRLEHDR